MKRIIEKSLILACIACFSFGLVSCDSDKNDVLDVLSDKQTENTDNIDQTPPSGLYCKVYDLGTDAKWINIPEVPFETADMIVINSDEEMKQYVEGGYTPIDFEKYTLLLAYGQEPYMNYPGNYVLLSNGENAFTLEITIVYSLCPALNYWRVGYLVEKAENAKYNLDFKRPEYPYGETSPGGSALYCEIYNLGPDAQWINIPEVPSETADLIVINSDEEMKQYVEGEYAPIDFEKYTFLLAYGEESYQNEPGDYVLLSNGDNTYTLAIKLLINFGTAYNYWRVGYLVEKVENAKYVIDLKRPTPPDGGNTSDIQGLYCEIYNLGPDAKWTNIPKVPSETADLIVINSDEEMKQYVEGKYTPIDFEHVTLLLAYGEESYQNEPGDYVLFSSGDNTYTLEITIKYYELPALNHWRVGYLVEKMENAKYVIDLKR